MKNWCAMPPVRALVGDGADQRGLAVVPAAAADAGAAAPPRWRGRRSRPGATRARRLPSARVDRDAGRARSPGPATALPARWVIERARVHRGEQGGAQEAVLEDVAHRAFVDLGGVEVQEEPGAAPSPARPSLIWIASIGWARRREARARGRGPPSIRRGGQRQRVGAAVEAGLGAGVARQGVENDAREPALGQRQRQHRTVQPAADDQHVAVVRHAPSIPRARRLSSRARPARLAAAAEEPGCRTAGSG